MIDLCHNTCTKQQASPCNNVRHAEVHMCGGVQLVVLSDRISEEDMDIKQPPIPTLLAVGAVHHHLIRFLLLLPCFTCICWNHLSSLASQRAGAVHITDVAHAWYICPVSFALPGSIQMHATLGKMHCLCRSWGHKVL